MPLAFSGQPIYLPASAYDITLKWKVVSCKGKGVTIDFEPAVTEKVVRGELIVIDGSKIMGLMRNGQLEITYAEDGIVTGLNAEASDKTGEVVATLVGTAGKLIVAGTPAGAGPAKCEIPAVAAMLNTIQAKTVELNTVQKELTKATEKVKTLTATVTQYGSSATRQQKAKLITAIDTLEKLTERQAAIEAAIDVAKKGLTAELKIEGWTPASNIFDYPTAFQIPKEKVTAWGLQDAEVKEQAIDLGIVLPMPIAFPSAPPAPASRRKIQGTVSTSSDEEPKVPVRNDLPLYQDREIPGMPYRVPAQVTFRFCKARSRDPIVPPPALPGAPPPQAPEPIPLCSKPGRQDTERDKVEHVNAFQYGQPFVLSLEFQTFTDRKYAIELNPNRTIKKITVSQQKSAGEGASKTLDAIADAYTVVQADRVKNANQDLTAQVATSKLELDLLETNNKIAQAQYLAATNPGDADLKLQLDQQTLEANLLKAQLDRLNAEQALAKAQAALDAS